MGSRKHRIPKKLSTETVANQLDQTVKSKRDAQEQGTITKLSRCPASKRTQEGRIKQQVLREALKVIPAPLDSVDPVILLLTSIARKTLAGSVSPQVANAINGLCNTALVAVKQKDAGSVGNQRLIIELAQNNADGGSSSVKIAGDPQAVKRAAKEMTGAVGVSAEPSSPRARKENPNTPPQQLPEDVRAVPSSPAQPPPPAQFTDEPVIVLEAAEGIPEAVEPRQQEQPSPEEDTYDDL